MTIVFTRRECTSPIEATTRCPSSRRNNTVYRCRADVSLIATHTFDAINLSPLICILILFFFTHLYVSAFFPPRVAINRPWRSSPIGVISVGLFSEARCRICKGFSFFLDGRKDDIHYSSSRNETLSAITAALMICTLIRDRSFRSARRSERVIISIAYCRHGSVAPMAFLHNEKVRRQ